MTDPASNVVPLDPHCDPRIDTLTDAIERLINERAIGMSVASVIGALEIVKAQLIMRMDLE
jgi:hypothetical protein